MRILIGRFLLLLALLPVFSAVFAQPTVSLGSPADNQILLSPDITFTWDGLPGTATKYVLKVSGVGFAFSYTKALYPNAADCKDTPTCAYIPTGLTLTNNKTYRWFIIAKISGGQVKSAKYDFSTAFPKPGSPALISPAHTGTVDGHQPTFEWQMGADTLTSQLRVFNGRGDLIFSRNLGAAQCPEDTCAVAMADFGSILPKKGKYTWWVRGKNPYGKTRSAVNAFSYAPSIASQMLVLVNDKRCKAGLAPVVLNAQLTAAAQRHSDDMAAHDFLDHEGTDGSNLLSRVNEAGYSGTPVGEILAGGDDTRTVQDAFKHWWTHPEKKTFIIDPTVREIGIAFAYNGHTIPKNFWTMVLGTRPDAAPGVCP